MSEETVVKVMGVPWDWMEDNFEFDLATFSRLTLEETFTKRTLLSSTARFFDPLGLLSPVILPLKCMFQEICHLKLGWDEALPEGHTSCWKELLQDMGEVSRIVVPRCILGDVQVEDITSIQLHGLADASKSAYGANVYIRLTTSGTSSVCLLASKTRFAPLIGESIPRLELMAALTLANLMTAVHEALTCTLKTDAVFSWTDSQIVWWWINREFKFKLFVQNRVHKIRSLWSKDHWRYCPSESNPANIASRGSKISVLAHSDLWWKGAPFLKEGEVQWPNLPDNPIGESIVPEEVTKKLRRKPEISNVMTVSVQCFQNISEVICPERFSSLSKLVRVTALVLKFIERLKRKIETNDISMEDQNIATNLWYKDVQAKLGENGFQT